MTAPVNEQKRSLKDWAWIALFVVLFGPFALIFASAILGIPILDVPGIGTWFMAALTVCGAVCFVGLIKDGIRHRKMPWVFLMVVGAATYWWSTAVWKAFQ